MAGIFDRKLRLPRIHLRVLLHAANMRHGTNGFTSLPKEGLPRIFFFALKNPTASARFEPANLGTKGQHATSRPPKPLARLPRPLRDFSFSHRYCWRLNYSGTRRCVVRQTPTLRRIVLSSFQGLEVFLRMQSSPKNIPLPVSCNRRIFGIFHAQTSARISWYVSKTGPDAS